MTQGLLWGLLFSPMGWAPVYRARSDAARMMGVSQAAFVMVSLAPLPRLLRLT
jgi:hypothetical protein